MLYLGMMSLDGDGADQSDKAAAHYLAEARRFVRRAEAAATSLEREHELLARFEREGELPRAGSKAADNDHRRTLEARAAARAVWQAGFDMDFRRKAKAQLREIDEAARETLEEEARYATVYAAPDSVALTS